MSERLAWYGQPYLDELRPDPNSSVRLALFATYSVDVSAVAATLLALMGHNDEKGSGTVINFAQAVEGLAGKVKILIQRGRIARPVALPKIAGRHAEEFKAFSVVSSMLMRAHCGLNSAFRSKAASSRL